MTMPIKFDTLEFVKKLTEAGIAPAHAEAQAQALFDALSEATVTPADQLILKAELLARMEEFKYEIYARLDELKHGMFARLDELKHGMFARLDELERETYTRLDQLERSLSAQIAELRREVYACIDTLAQQLGGRIGRLNSKMLWFIAIVLGLHAVEIGVLLSIAGRLP